jgi:hypothetical protein
MGAERPQFYTMRAKDGDPLNEKLRVTFWMKDKESSLKIYKHFTENKSIMDESARVAIFLQKTEETFNKYADIEAEKYQKLSEEAKVGHR